MARSNCALLATICHVKARSGGGKSKPEPITLGSSPSTSEINKQEMGRASRYCHNLPPLIRERLRRKVLICVMLEPSASIDWVAACKPSNVQSSANTSTKLDAPPESKNSNGSSAGNCCTYASRRCPARNDDSSGTGCAVSHTSTVASLRVASLT